MKDPDTILAAMQVERLELLERLRKEASLTLDAFDEWMRTLRAFDEWMRTSQRPGLPHVQLERLRHERDQIASWLRRIELAIAGD